MPFTPIAANDQTFLRSTSLLEILDDTVTHIVLYCTCSFDNVSSASVLIYNAIILKTPKEGSPAATAAVAIAWLPIYNKAKQLRAACLNAQ